MDHAPTPRRSTPRGPARPRASLSDPPLLRLLSRLGEPGVPASAEPLTARLSRWLDWTVAPELSSLLATPLPTQPLLGVPLTEVKALTRELARVRQQLSQAILEPLGSAAAPTVPRRPLRPVSATPPPAASALLAALPDPEADFAPLRRRCLARQQAMETAIAALRQRLRSALGAATPELARLAALDAVMEQVLAPHERTQLAQLPRALERRFERQQRAHRAGDTSWLPALHHDLQQLLLAELELRMHPVEGLLEALTALPSSRP